MVKVAEKERKRHPLTAVFGLLIAVGLFAISWVLTNEVLVKRIPQVASAVREVSWGRVGIAIGLWVFLLAISFGLVAILVGKDPEDTSKIPLPPKASELKKQKQKQRR